MTPAIEVVGVSKHFRLYHEKYSSLKERVIHFGRVPSEEFFALRDINLDIAQGETVGLLGRNGSGKSTLLKCIAGILQPTDGWIASEGRMAALLELGAGFHPDLTGRENVFLNASILGMPKKEIERRFEEIVAFAELEAFIDNQVKHYSSGMYVRLGFAVAVNMEPEILLVDEVLAVGDESFQRKCLERVRQFQKEGRTIVFVTHDLDRVRQICDRAAVLEDGVMVTLGTPGEAIRSLREYLYDTHQDDGDGEATDNGSPASSRNLKCRIAAISFDHPDRRSRRHLFPGEPLSITIDYEAREPLDDIVFGIGIFDTQGREIFGTNTEILEVPVSVEVGHGTCRFDIGSVPLLDGTYLVTVGIQNHGYGETYDWSDQQHSFEVLNPGRAAGLVDMPVQVNFSTGPRMREPT